MRTSKTKQMSASTSKRAKKSEMTKEQVARIPVSEKFFPSGRFKTVPSLTSAIKLQQKKEVKMRLLSLLGGVTPRRMDVAIVDKKDFYSYVRTWRGDIRNRNRNILIFDEATVDDFWTSGFFKDVLVRTFDGVRRDVYFVTTTAGIPTSVFEGEMPNLVLWSPLPDETKSMVILKGPFSGLGIFPNDDDYNALNVISHGSVVSKEVDKLFSSSDVHKQRVAKRLLRLVQESCFDTDLTVTAELPESVEESWSGVDIDEIRTMICDPALETGLRQFLTSYAESIRSEPEKNPFLRRRRMGAFFSSGASGSSPVIDFMKYVALPAYDVVRRTLLEDSGRYKEALDNSVSVVNDNLPVLFSSAGFLGDSVATVPRGPKAKISSTITYPVYRALADNMLQTLTSHVYATGRMMLSHFERSVSQLETKRSQGVYDSLDKVRTIRIVYRGEQINLEDVLSSSFFSRGKGTPEKTQPNDKTLLDKQAVERASINSLPSIFDDSLVRHYGVLDVMIRGQEMIINVNTPVVYDPTGRASVSYILDKMAAVVEQSSRAQLLLGARKGSTDLKFPVAVSFDGGEVLWSETRRATLGVDSGDMIKALFSNTEAGDGARSWSKLRLSSQRVIVTDIERARWARSHASSFLYPAALNNISVNLTSSVDAGKDPVGNVLRTKEGKRRGMMRVTGHIGYNSSHLFNVITQLDILAMAYSEKFRAAVASGVATEGHKLFSLQELTDISEDIYNEAADYVVNGDK